MLVLNDCNIDKAGESEDLKKKCSTVRELDLAQNNLQEWNEVFTILSHMPSVEFVNLSLNRLYAPIAAAPSEISMARLKSLVLNNTHLEWESVDTLLNLLPALEELHLSLNDYKNVLIDTLEEEYLGSFDETTAAAATNIEDDECCSIVELEVEEGSTSDESNNNNFNGRSSRTSTKRSEGEKIECITVNSILRCFYLIL